MSTNTEKLKIATDFLLQAPPGEFDEVFNDVRILVDNDDIFGDSIIKVISKYNMEHFVPCTIDDKHNCLITVYGELGPGKYYDPCSKQIFTFDHLKRKMVPGSLTDKHANFIDANSGKSEEKTRVALEKAFTIYSKEHYPNGTFSVYNLAQNANVSSLLNTITNKGGNNSSTSSQNTTTLVVCLEDHMFNPKNYWNGRWRSCWLATMQSNASEGDIRGIFKIIVHYYEDGNVQLLAKKEVNEKFKISSDPEQTAKEIMKIISKEEQNYQNALSDCYRSMSESTFKALRRQLPVTRNKIEWERIAAYKVGQELGGGKKL